MPVRTLKIILHKDGHTRRFDVEPQINRRPAMRRLLDAGWEITEETKSDYIEYMGLVVSDRPHRPTRRPWEWRPKTTQSATPASVWYVIPSANRELCNKCFVAWRQMGYHTAVLADRVWARDDVWADVMLYCRQYNGYPAAVRELCKEIGDRADIIITGGDDVYPDPTMTAAEIAAQFHEHFPDGFGVMQPIGDDYPGTDRICGSPWMGRRFCDTINGGGGPFWHEYTHFFCDEEMFEVARKLGCLWQRKDLTQYHDHWSRNGGEQQPYHLKHQKQWDTASHLFHKRKLAGFPGHEPVGQHDKAPA